MIQTIRKEIVLLPTLTIFGYLILNFLPNLPIYTKLAFVYFLLPSIFFLFRSGEKFNKKKLLTILLFSILIIILWDNVAIHAGLWNFPKGAIGFWIFGVPFEEYVFGFAAIIWILGVYTSLPHFRHGTIKEPHFSDTPLLIVVFLLQLSIFASFFLLNSISYIKWLLILAIIPSIYYLFRKRERIDEVRLIIACLLAIATTFILDPIFIKNVTWFYGETAIFGRIGNIPIDDILFAVFNTIVIIGFYTSLPSKNVLTAKW